MSDVEIIEVGEPSGNKRRYNDAKNGGFSAKRKRTSSGLIEKSEIMKGTETEFEEFVIDRTVTRQRKLNVEDIENSAEGSNTSQWRKRLESTLLGFEPVADESQKGRNPRYKKVCFNCDGEHTVFDCPLPKDHKRIAKNKRESGEEVRRRQELYNTGLTNQKQNNFKPGQLSEKLRYALGLDEYDIPEHVYRMRRIGFIKGYPPGWMQKAIKSTGLLKYFTSEGDDKAVDCDEPPELDSSKIIWYPGFNESSAELNDLETFKIPPKTVFCERFQKELKDTHKKMKKAEKKQEKKQGKKQQKMQGKIESKKQKGKPQHKKFADDSDDDVVIIDAEHPKKEFVTPGEENIVTVLGDGKQFEVPTRPHKNVEIGNSMYQTIGTPVFVNQPLADVPSLEAFSVGIQPFEARDEEVQSKGIFRKLMNSLNKIRENAELSDEKDPDVEIIEITEDSATSSSIAVPLKKSKRKRNRKKKNANS